MINLLPPEIKKSLVYARRNRKLAKWGIATAIGIAGIGLVVLIGLFYINSQINAYANEVERTRASLNDQNMEDTQKRIKEIDDSVKLALQVLSKEVLFSRLLTGIGAAMPPGSSLQNLSIGEISGALDLQAIAVDYQTASQVQVNLEDPRNQIFEKADIVSISCNQPSGEDAEEAEVNLRYPCQVNIRALFAKDSPFLFSSESAGDNR